MSDDLELEHVNVAGSKTSLFATHQHLGTDRLEDFSGDYIFEVKPDGASKRNPFGGIFARGTGKGAGVRGISTSGTGLRGSSTSGVGVLGTSTDSNGVRGVAAAAEAPDNTSRIGVSGEGATGVQGTSTVSRFAAVAGWHAGRDGIGVAGFGDTGVLGACSPNRSGSGVRGEGYHGVSGLSTERLGAGVRGEGDTGVLGFSQRPEFAAISAFHIGANGYGVAGIGATGVAGTGHGHNNIGVSGAGNVGVLGETSGTGHSGAIGKYQGRQGHGVIGTCTGSGSAVLGRNQTDEGPGVQGVGDTGVLGISDKDRYAALAGLHSGNDGFGVVGVGDTGILGVSSEPGYAGVGAANLAEGFGVIGYAAAGGTTAGVLGLHGAPAGAGVRGEGGPGVTGKCSLPGNGTGSDEHLSGVVGESEHGPGILGIGVCGGKFSGTRAQLDLVPAGSVGRPTAGDHNKGELFVDAAATMFVCVADGSPGTWVRVVTEPA